MIIIVFVVLIISILVLLFACFIDSTTKSPAELGDGAEMAGVFTDVHVVDANNTDIKGDYGQTGGREKCHILGSGDCTVGIGDTGDCGADCGDYGTDCGDYGADFGDLGDFGGFDFCIDGF